MPGIGFNGQARILIAKHKPTQFFNTVRHINLELLSSEQLEEVQQEMKLSQLLHHHNIACYLTSFVVGVHLWAVQPLMHYGELNEANRKWCILLCIHVYVTLSLSPMSL